ncbi:MAG: endonuclease/exonuclease/phosphatase family protein, partial [Pyrinomonadaceae bacterium]
IDAVIAGQANPNYTAYLISGNDVGGINVGFLVKGRILVVNVTQFGKTETFIDPATGNPALLNDRPPLVLRAAMLRPDTGAPLPFTVIVNHLRSLSGVDDPADGNRVRVKRRAQAEYLANLIQVRQKNNPNEIIISVGDYNAFQVNDGFVDSIGTIKGMPAPVDEVLLASSGLVNPVLTDLVDRLPLSERYSFTFDGNAQTLDHILLNRNALLYLNRFQYARSNADFPLKYYEDPNRPERISDHDMPIAYFTLAAPSRWLSH